MHNLFVYGTLQKGYGNCSWVMGPDCVCMGPKITVDKFVLFSPSFPIAVDFTQEPETHPLLPVVGELWQVDDGTLARADSLEGHPNWYRRRQVQLMTGETAWMYAQSKWQTSPLAPLAYHKYYKWSR